MSSLQNLAALTIFKKAARKKGCARFVGIKNTMEYM
jgi:hypothetical protein